MNIVVIDGQSGRMGQLFIEKARTAGIAEPITAIGTNALATAAMLKAGATQGATGENPVLVACRSADIIVGPIGILVADAMLGEITEKMACAVARAASKRILIPMNRCDHIIAGVGEQSLSALIADAVDKIAALACPLD
jgi:prephenate dehydrogenase